jgi:hypothetical protein
LRLSMILISLQNVTTLRLSMMSGTDNLVLFDSLHDAWPTLAPRLHVLDIAMHVLHASTVSRFSVSHLEGLKQLRLSIVWARPPDDMLMWPAKDMVKLARWIVAAGAKPSSLVLDSNVIAYGSQDFYQTLAAARLPHLSSMDFTFPTRWSSRVPLIEDSCLSELTLDFTVADLTTPARCLEELPPFPALTRLKLVLALPLNGDSCERLSSALASVLIDRTPVLHTLLIIDPGIVLPLFRELARGLAARTAPLHTLALCWALENESDITDCMLASVRLLQASGLRRLPELVLSARPRPFYYHYPRPIRTRMLAPAPAPAMLHVSCLRLCGAEDEEVQNIWRTVMKHLMEIPGLLGEVRFVGPDEEMM